MKSVVAARWQENRQKNKEDIAKRPRNRLCKPGRVIIAVVNGQLVWGCTYLVLIMTISVCSGVFLVRCKGLPIMNSVEKFCIGFSLTPLLLALWMILVSFLPTFWGKQYVVLFAPFLAAVVYLLSGRKILADKGQLMAKHLFQSAWSKALALLCLLLFVYKIIASISGYMIYHDAAFYMGEALKFSQSLSFHDISTFRDMGDGSLNGSVHNFIWPAYISYGMICTDFQSSGFAHDFAALLSIRLMVLYLLVALWGLVYAVCRKITMCNLSIIIFFLVPFTSILQAYSRDFFRMIPLLLIIELFYVEAYRIPKGEAFSVFGIVLLMLVVFFIPSGHPINLFVAFPIGVIWIVCHVLEKKEIRSLASSVLAIAVAGILGIYNIIYAVLATGSTDGNCSLYFDNIFEGTNLKQVYLDYMASTMSIDMGFLQTAKKIFYMDRFKINLICIVLCVICCIVSLAMQKKHKNNFIFIPLCYLAAVFMIILGDFIPWGGFSYSNWLSRNSRYAFQFYMLAIPCIVFVLNCLIDGKKVERITGAVVSLFCSIIALNVLMTYDAKAVKIWEQEYFSQSGARVLDALERAEDGKNVLVGQSDFAYTSGLRVKVLPSYYGVDLFAAQSPEDVANYFTKNNIEYICLECDYLPIFWKYAVFYNCMQTMESVELITKTDRIEVYQYRENNNG